MEGEKTRLLAELLSLRGDLGEGRIDNDTYTKRFLDIQERLKSIEHSDNRLQEFKNRYTKGNISHQRQEEYTMLNGILFLSFIVPALFAIILRLPMNFFYFWIIVWVHESGHGFWCLMGNRLLCAFAGFLNEMLFTAVPALICFKRREIYLSGCILLMCAGMSIQHNGAYMQSAEHPYGTSFAGALTGRHGDMTEENHDWSIIFQELGLIHHSYRIGKFTEEVGRALAIILFITSLVVLFPMMYGWTPRRLTNMVGAGAMVSTLYFILSKVSCTEIILSMLLSIPILKKVIIWGFKFKS